MDIEIQKKDMGSKDLDNTWKNLLIKLFTVQRHAVLATTNGNVPYCSLMTFAVKDDLSQIILATPEKTEKFKNIKSNPQVSMLIDDRQNKASDSEFSMAVTVLGRAKESSSQEQETVKGIFLTKNPYLDEFVQASTTRLIQVDVDQYVVARRFQEVTVINLSGKSD